MKEEKKGHDKQRKKAEFTEYIRKSSRYRFVGIACYCLYEDHLGVAWAQQYEHTANIYSHIDRASKKETAQAIGELLG